MAEIVTLSDLSQLQGADVQIILVHVFVLLQNLLARRCQHCVHIVDTHIGYAVNENLNIRHEAAKTLMCRHLTKQAIVDPAAFQQVNHSVTQTQLMQLGVWVIFCFRHPQQVVRRYAIEPCQRRDAERTQLNVVVGLVTAERRLRYASLLGKLFQRQVSLRAQILQPLRVCQFDIHRSRPLLRHYTTDFRERGNFRFSARFPTFRIYGRHPAFSLLWSCAAQSTLKTA